MKHYSLIIAILVWIIGGYLIFYFRPYDNTDNAAEGERSGMTLYTDNLTGCQYLRFGIFGGTMPRVKDNIHIGCN